ncbi:MAG: hypothetical protein AAGJ50_04100 [Pseudomonadota bacterium]
MSHSFELLYSAFRRIEHLSVRRATTTEIENGSPKGNEIVFGGEGRLQGMGIGDATEVAEASQLSSAEYAYLVPLVPIEGAMGLADEIARAVGEMTIITEDVSPDTVLAFLILLARRLGCLDPSHDLDQWLKSARIWRKDGNARGAPYGDWCALHSAGVHTYFTQDPNADLGNVFGAAWLAGLRFLCRALALNCHPTKLPNDPICKEHTAFHAALEREEDLYKDWLTNADRVQLRFPLRDTPSRYRLVDALFLEEGEATGALRVFYRRDFANSFHAHGFDVALTHRSTSPAGYRYVLSADPGAGVTLGPAEAALERAETAAWADIGLDRPADGDPDTGPTWQAPWGRFAGQGDFLPEPEKTNHPDLPAHLADAGTLQSWTDIKNAIWRATNPLAAVRVKMTPHTPISPTPELKDMPLLSVSPPEDADRIHGKSCLILAWSEGEGADTSIMVTPTARRYLAALTRPASSMLEPMTFQALPPESAFKVVGLDGGFAVISDDGIVLFDDWQANEIDIPLALAICESCALQDERLRELSLDLTQLQADFAAAVDSWPIAPMTPKEARRQRRRMIRKQSQSQLARLLRRIVALQISLRSLQGGFVGSDTEDFDAANRDASAVRLRNQLELSWRLQERGNTYAKLLEDMQTSVKNLFETRSIEVQRTIFQLGFAITPAAVLSEPTGEILGPLLSNSIAGAGWTGYLPRLVASDAIAVMQILSAGVLAIVFFLGLRWFSTSVEQGAMRDTATRSPRQSDKSERAP